MNRIFKKIWNRHRGCFVAVSECMTSTAQTAGKKAALLSAALLMCGTINGAEVHDGDFIVPDNGYGMFENPYEVWTINGNLIDRSPTQFYVIGARENGTINVNGDLIISFDEKYEGTEYPTDFAISHVHQRTYQRGELNVQNDFLIDNSSSIDFTTFHDDVSAGTAIGILNVGGTFTLGAGSWVHVGGAVKSGQIAQPTANINNLLVYGTYYAPFTTDVKFDSVGRTESVRNINSAIIYSGGAFHQNYLENGFDTVKFGKLTLENGSTIYSTDGLIVGGEAIANRVTVTDSLNLNGGAINQRNSLTQNSGTVTVNSGSYDFETYVKANGTLSNKSSLSVANFNQSGGTTTNNGTLTIGNANLYGSLTSTGTLNLTGSVTSRGNLSSSGTLNNQGTWTEANAFNIAGTLNNTGTVNFQNGFSFASNGKLNSSGTVKTSNASNIFDSLGSMTSQELKYVSLGASTPQAVRTSLNNFFRKYLPGTVSQTLAQNASFTGGKIVITGVNLTTTQRDDLVKAFKAQFFPLSSGISASAVFEQC